MLLNPNEGENNSNENKLFGADSNNSKLDDSPAAEPNENSLFGSPLNNTTNNSSHDSLFDSSYDESDIASKDAFIDSSFVISDK